MPVQASAPAAKAAPVRELSAKEKHEAYQACRSAAIRGLIEKHKPEYEALIRENQAAMSKAFGQEIWKAAPKQAAKSPWRKLLPA